MTLSHCKEMSSFLEVFFTSSFLPAYKTFFRGILHFGLVQFGVIQIQYAFTHPSLNCYDVKKKKENIAVRVHTF